MLDELMLEIEEKMEKAIIALENNLKTVRTGRANPNMLEGIEADYYGSPTPINQMASISVQEGRTLVIKPYDKSALKGIEHAINTSSLGLPAQNDGSVIRVSVPQLTEETRKGYCKDADKMAEEGKVAIRNIRRDGNDAVKKDKTLTEDESKGALEDIQKLTDKFVEKIDSIKAAKEKDIMTI